MVVVNPLSAVSSLSAHGRYGFSGGYGLLRHGVARNGFYDENAGIYHKKRTARGIRLSRMVFYRPTNPRTVAQQAWRSTFTAAWGAWGALTAPQKALFYSRASAYSLSGPQLFLREYLQAHRS